MARVRTRLKRTVYLLIALAILYLLLQLNQWLPGTWPGGGGGGFRAAGEMGAPDPDAAGTDDATTSKDPGDLSTVLPPDEAPTEWPPKNGVTVQVHGPDGKLAEGWRLGLGDGGAEDKTPSADDTLRLRDRRAFGEGFRVRAGRGLVRHRHGTGDRASRWSIHIPSGKLPLQVRRRELRVTVVDPRSGDPIEGAHVDYKGAGKDVTVTTDARGEALIRAPSVDPLQVRVRKDGHATMTALLSPQDPSDIVLDLDEILALEVEYVQHADAVLTAQLLLADGTALKGDVSMRGGGTGQRATFQVPRRELATSWLETLVGTDGGRYVFRRPARELTEPVTIPGGKVLSVHVRDEYGKTMQRVKTTVEAQTYDGAQAEDEPRGAVLPGDGAERPTLVVAQGARARLRIEAPGAAPIVRALTSLDGTDKLDFVAEAGLHIPVQVFGADGRALVGAHIKARASVGGVRILRRADAAAEGRAALGPFGAGPIEVFVVADGHAPAAQVVDASAAMATVTFRLGRGFPLRVVVEDPFGRALEGVTVEVTPAGPSSPLVFPPEALPRRTDAKGTFTLRGAPNGLFHVTLTLPGYGAQKLRSVRPGAVTYFATLIKTP